MKTQKIKVFTAEDFRGNFYYSLISFQDILENETAYLMPGGFSTLFLTEKQVAKLEELDAEGTHTHYLKGERVFSYNC